MKRVLPALLALLGGSGCVFGGGGGEQPEPECVADTDCDDLQICGEAGVSEQDPGVCLWVSGRTFAVEFVSATITGGGSEDPDTEGAWDLPWSGGDGAPDPTGGVIQGVNDPQYCSDIQGDTWEATFSPNGGCILSVYPGQPLQIVLWDQDGSGDGGGEDDPIETWSFEGEEGYAELLREPATKRLEGEWASIFITVYDF